MRFSQILVSLLLIQLLLPGAAISKTAYAEIGSNKIDLEIARTQKEISRGLMYRKSMPEDHGMVFLFRPRKMERFWMGHCFMSLDMLFIRDGKIITISRKAPPYTGINPRKAPLYPVEGPIEVTEVLELNSGYCERHGIKDGDTVKFDLPDDKPSEPTAEGGNGK